MLVIALLNAMYDNIYFLAPYINIFTSAYLSLVLKQNTVRCLKLEKPQKNVTLITHEFYTFCAKLIQHGFLYERKSVKFEGIPKVATPPPPEKKIITLFFFRGNSQSPGNRETKVQWCIHFSNQLSGESYRKLDLRWGST